MKSVVSILIPAYNAEEWIADTIRSALAQTWPNKEIIIVDDGSTDHTLSVAQQFASREVTVITQANQGAAAARNKAYSLCHGDYIQWLDADDLLAPDKIERQMEIAAQCQSRRTLLSSAWGCFMHRPQGTKFIPSPLWFDLSPVEWLARKMGQNLHMQTSTWLVSRELTEAAGPWDNRLSLDDDGEYFCRVLLASNGTRFVPQARVLYRMTGSNSLSNVGYSVKKLESQFLSMSLHVKYVRSLEDSERVRSACVKYLNTWLPAFYRQSPDLVERLERLAKALGGRLETPALTWKYAWIEKVFGWTLARRTQLFLPMFKQSLLRVLDKARLRFNRKISADHRNI
jgi:glycosyltransferase involved in cell wall biosynthesis